jgi:hypothetical protein
MAKGSQRGSKMAGVRQALAELGNDAKPVAIQEYLKKAGIDMSTNMVSNYKTHILKKSGKRRKRRGRKLVVAKAAAAPAPRNSIGMADLQQIKALTDRIGADKVRELATLLGK